MTNNDILRRLRYTFDFSDEQMIGIFELADQIVSRAVVSNWMKKEEDEDHQNMTDLQLCSFLDGLINLKRGKREDRQDEPLEYLSNNMILRKLKIACSYKNEDLLEILKLVDMRISKHELSAFFRNPKQSQYRPLKDQILRKFIYGLQIKHRGKEK
jgi:uncharacterized protein YehS (DUF1456 family)